MNFFQFLEDYSRQMLEDDLDRRKRGTGAKIQKQPAQ